jgi:GDP-4-dehydro-6-deoxy-D-mannose reductase
LPSILITGSAGFIGQHLVPVLQRGGDVLALDRRAGNIETAEAWSALPAANVVIHLAGKSFVPASWADPSIHIRANLSGALAALEYCRKHRARLVFLSSYLYGTPEQLPIPETAPLRVTNPYALSKQLAEETCRFYAEHFGLDVTILRPFNAYGAGQASSFLIPAIVQAVEAGEPIHVKDLEPRRDYVHVADLVRAIVAATRGPAGYSVFNVGSGVSHSVAEVISLVQELWGTSLPVVSEGVRRAGEIMDTVADVSAAARALQWRPQISLAEGLQRMRQAGGRQE